MPPLDGTLAFTQVKRVPVVVGYHLNLDMPRVDDRLLDVDLAIAERPLCFALGRFQHRLQFPWSIYQSHAFAAAAGHRLEHHWITELRCKSLRFLERR